MLKIGVFSKFSQIPVSVLRYYDEIGLLSPAHTDAETGYRYYRTEQLSDVNRIIALKNLGLPLNQIQHLMNENISVSEIRGILLLRKSQIEQSIEEEYARLNNVEMRLQQIELEGSTHIHDVIVKAIPSQSYLSIRKTLPIEKIAFVFDKLYEQLTYYQINYPGPAVGVVHDVNRANPNTTLLDIEMGYLAYRNFPKHIHVPHCGEGTLRKLPKLTQVASLIHRGQRASIHKSYSQLRNWMQRNQYKAKMPVREIYIVPGIGQEDSGSITEIQVVVQKAQ